MHDKVHIQKQGTAMGTKMAPAYANIFMGTLKSRILSQTTPSSIHWKRYTDDIFLVWADTKESLEQFIKSINDLHPCINFTTEFSREEITFLDLFLYKGERFAKEGILDLKTHIKPTNTQQYVHASSRTLSNKPHNAGERLTFTTTYSPHLPTYSAPNKESKTFNFGNFQL